MLALCGLRPRIERNDAGDFVVLRGHLPQSGSLLESTVAKCRLCSRTLALCGLRPRIERNDCNFGRRLPCGHSPEATFAQCSLCARKMRLKINFHSFFLHICIFCCTFVASIQMKTVKTLHFYAINTMYISA